MMRVVGVDLISILTLLGIVVQTEETEDEEVMALANPSPKSSTMRFEVGKFD